MNPKLKSIFISTNIIIGSYMVLFLISILMLTVINLPNQERTVPFINEEFASLYKNVTFPMFLSLIVLPILIEKLIFKNSLHTIGLTLFGNSKKHTILIYSLVLLGFSILYISYNNKYQLILLSLYLVVQCLGEDILFRSVFQRRLHQHFNPLLAIVVVTVVFVFVFHSDTFLNNLLYRMPLGLLMSFTYYKTQSVFPVFSIHFINNLYFSI